MKKHPSPVLCILSALIICCAAPRPYRFTHTYTVPQALRFVRQMLIDRGYRIAIFDTASGIVKTERKEYPAEDGSTITHQISVMVVTPDELLIKVLPASVRNRTDQIMAPVAESLQMMGFKTERAVTASPE